MVKDPIQFKVFFFCFRWSYRQVWCMKKMLWVLFVLCLASSSLAEESDRQERVFSPFTVVRFQNDVCGGGTRNGTCLTMEVCEEQVCLIYISFLTSISTRSSPGLHPITYKLLTTTYELSISNLQGNFHAFCIFTEKK